jgi:hypothetical protein
MLGCILLTKLLPDSPNDVLLFTLKVLNVTSRTSAKTGSQHGCNPNYFHVIAQQCLACAGMALHIKGHQITLNTSVWSLLPFWLGLVANSKVWMSELKINLI